MEKETLSTLTRPVKLYPQRLVNVPVIDKHAAMQAPEVLAAVDKANEALGGIGRVFVRASGTEELVRVLSEAPDEETCAKASAPVLEALKKIEIDES